MWRQKAVGPENAIHELSSPWLYLRYIGPFVPLAHLRSYNMTSLPPASLVVFTPDSCSPIVGNCHLRLSSMR